MTTRRHDNVTRSRGLQPLLKDDPDLPFGAVQRAIEIARESGVRVVAVVTERRVGAESASP